MNYISINYNLILIVYPIYNHDFEYIRISNILNNYEFIDNE